MSSKLPGMNNEQQGGRSSEQMRAYNLGHELATDAARRGQLSGERMGESIEFLKGVRANWDAALFSFVEGVVEGAGAVVADPAERTDPRYSILAAAALQGMLAADCNVADGLSGDKTIRPHTRESLARFQAHAARTACAAAVYADATAQALYYIEACGEVDQRDIEFGGYGARFDKHQAAQAAKEDA